MCFVWARSINCLLIDQGTQGDIRVATYYWQVLVWRDDYDQLVTWMAEHDIKYWWVLAVLYKGLVQEGSIVTQTIIASLMFSKTIPNSKYISCFELTRDTPYLFIICKRYRSCLNTSRLRQNVQLFTSEILKCIASNNGLQLFSW